MYFAASEKSDQPICMYELGRYVTRMQMRFPTDWIDRIIVSSEKGYKRIEDVRLQLAFATNNKVYLRTELEETTDLIEEHADEILYEYSMVSKNNKLTW
jgi:Ribonuclease G/E